VIKPIVPYRLFG